MAKIAVNIKQLAEFKQAKGRNKGWFWPYASGAKKAHFFIYPNPGEQTQTLCGQAHEVTVPLVELQAKSIHACAKCWKKMSDLKTALEFIKD